MTPDQREGNGPARRSAATAAAAGSGAGSGAGLSIVVPVYNEAAGLAALHRRIGAVAARLRAERGLTCELV